jgi:hypothetical protein
MYVYIVQAVYFLFLVFLKILTGIRIKSVVVATIIHRLIKNKGTHNFTLIGFVER